LDKVSLWALGGRMIVPLIYGEYQEERFDRMRGRVDLVYRGGKFFLYSTVDLPDDGPIEPEGFLGVDLGIVNIATDSDGDTYSGEAVERTRRRHQENCKRFQKLGSKGVKRKLKKLAGREARFRKHENHCISKALVQKAKETDRGNALEDLKGIRDQTTFRAKDRDRQTGWSFSRLRLFVEYKAQLAGVPIVLVDPRNASRTCSNCGHCEDGNRKSQAKLLCKHCGYSANADFNAALNIRDRAAVNQPQNWRSMTPDSDPGEISRKAVRL
jgi:putative transposase